MALSRALVMALAVAGLAPAHSAQAQDFPTQRVTIVVPFGAGSVTDISARIVADEMAKRWGQQVIVENRPGLAGTVGRESRRGRLHADADLERSYRRGAGEQEYLL